MHCFLSLQNPARQKKMSRLCARGGHYVTLARVHAAMKLVHFKCSPRHHWATNLDRPALREQSQIQYLSDCFWNCLGSQECEDRAAGVAAASFSRAVPQLRLNAYSLSWKAAWWAAYNLFLEGDNCWALYLHDVSTHNIQTRTSNSTQEFVTKELTKRQKVFQRAFFKSPQVPLSLYELFSFQLIFSIWKQSNCASPLTTSKISRNYLLTI